MTPNEPEKVKRYDMGFTSHTMDEYDEGDYVLHTDHLTEILALQSKLEAAEKDNKELKSSIRCARKSLKRKLYTMTDIWLSLVTPNPPNSGGNFEEN